MSSFSSTFIPAMGLVEEEKLGLGGEGPSQLHALLEPVGQPAAGVFFEWPGSPGSR